MPIKTIKFTKMVKNSTYYSIGGIRLYDKSNQLIEVLFNEPNKLTTNTFTGKYTGTVNTTNSYSTYYYVDSPFDTTKSQIGNYNSINYWLSSSANEISMTFDEPIGDLGRIEFSPYPQNIDTRKQNSITLELVDENDIVILSKTIDTKSATPTQIYSEDVAMYSLYRNFVFRKDGKIYTTVYKEPEQIPIMTSNTAPAPYVVSASSTYNSTYAPWKAFNKTLNSYTDSWLSRTNHSNERISIKLKEKARCTSVQLVSRDYNTNDRAFPETFTVDASDDGVNWITLAKYDNQTAGVKEYKLYEFRNNNEYLYYSIGNMNNSKDPTIQMALGQVNFNLVPTHELVEVPRLTEEYLKSYGKAVLDGLSHSVNTYSYVLENENNTDDMYSVKMKHKPLSISFKEGK